MSFIHDLEPIAVYSMIRTLKDTFYKEINNVCLNSGVDFEAKWLALFQLLLKKENITINQIAKELRQSHVSIVQKINELKRKHVVVIKIDNSDHRKKLVRLSQYGKDLAKKSQKTWNNLNRATKDLLDEHAPGFLNMLRDLEESLRMKGISKRIEEFRLKNNNLHDMLDSPDKITNR